MNEGHIVESGGGVKLSADNRGGAVVAMVDFDTEDGVDSAGALKDAIQALGKFEWDSADIDFSFNQVETKMQTSGVMKQWSKLQALVTVLPKNIIEEIKPLLRKKESEWTNNDAYLRVKNEVIRIFGSNEDEVRFERAMGRVLSGQPSQLARGLVDDLCDKQLNGCCCKRFIGGLWKRQLPSNVLASIADVNFDADTYNAVLQTADRVHASQKRHVIPPVAAVAASFPGQWSDSGPPGPHDTAFRDTLPEDGAEVAAYGYNRGGRGGGRGQGRGQSRGQGRGQNGGRGSGGRGGFNRGSSSARGGGGGNGRGGSSNAHPRHKTQRHADQPPWESCFRHWTHGKSAHFCMEPGTCPWKDFFIPKANN